MKKVPLVEVKDHLSQYLHDAEQEHIIITRHGKPAGVLIGFESEDDWFEYRLLNDADFQHRVEEARAKLKKGKGISWEEIKKKSD
jgi:prevent-host-death family protein